MLFVVCFVAMVTRLPFFTDFRCDVFFDIFLLREVREVSNLHNYKDGFDHSQGIHFHCEAWAMSEDEVEASLRAVAAAFGDSTAALVCTGAGSSVDSGIPDYRGDGGSWGSDPRAELLYDVTAEQRSRAGSWFQRDPSAAWGHECHSMERLARGRPHEGHVSLNALLAQRPHFVLTSNCDALHERSGVEPSRVYACHGRIFEGADTGAVRVQCSYLGTDTCPEGDPRKVWTVDRQSLRVDPETGRADLDRLPLCMSCFKPARPNMQYFEDHWCEITEISLGAPSRAAMVAFCKEHANAPGAHLLVLEIGAGDVCRTVRNRAGSITKACLEQGGLVTYARLNLHQSGREPAGTSAFPESALEETYGVRYTFVSVPLTAQDALVRLARCVSAAAAASDLPK